MTDASYDLAVEGGVHVCDRGEKMDESSCQSIGAPWRRFPAISLFVDPERKDGRSATRHATHEHILLRANTA